MLTRLFIRILNMSVTAGLMILAVLVLRLLLKRAPRIFSYALWAVVLFRLLCPISFESGFSLLGVLRAPTAESGSVEYISPELGETPPAVEYSAGRNAPGQETTDFDGGMAAGKKGEAWQTVLSVGSCIWLLGALGMLFYGAVSYGRLSYRLRGAKEITVMRCGGKRIRIRCGGIAATPFVLGFLRPCIYLPEGLPQKDLEYILLHERIHICRGDLLTRAGAWLALCLHWFHPLVWLAFFLSEQDMEMSCDEAVIRRIGSAVKKDYSMSLLSLASGRRITAGIPLAFGEGEPGRRIKNVLRYKKPAFALAAAALAACVLAAVFLLGNPENRGKKTQDQIFYGVIEAVAESGGGVVLVPQIGEMEIPEAETVEPYIEMDFSGLEEGQLVRIVFSGGEAAEILGTDPGRFSRKADSIQVMGVGFAMRPLPDGTYLFAVPLGMAREAQAGDTLRIYHAVLEEGDLMEDYHLFLLESPEKIATKLLAETKVTEVDAENFHIWVTLSGEAANTFLSEFGFGVSCEREAGEQTGSGEEEAKEPQNLTREMELTGEVPDGIYWVYARSLSYSARCFDRYVTDASLEEQDRVTLLPAFAEDCVFLVNREMDSVRFEKVGFEEFADLMTKALAQTSVPVRCTFQNNLIVEAQLMSTYLDKGISYMPLTEGSSWIEDICEDQGRTLEDVLEEFYELARTVEADVSDAPGMERLEIYRGNLGDGDSGVLLFYDAAGRLLHIETAHCARAGWANLYVGELDKTPFILSVHIEDRDDYGEYWYQVYRLGETGTLQQIAGSDFVWRSDIRSYDDGLFHEWADRLERYLANSRLLLSTQEGELRTDNMSEDNMSEDGVSEADKYNYETLRRR